MPVTILYYDFSVQKAIDDVKVTANYDKPVGMFDGLIQTMVCGVGIHKLISLCVWKEKRISRHDKPELLISVNVLVKRFFLLFRIFRSCSIFNVSLNQCSCNQTPKLQKFIFVSGTCFCVSLQWYLAWKFKGPFATQNSSVKSNLIAISSRFIYSAINERITSWENNKQTQRQTDILKPISNTYNAKEHFFSKQKPFYILFFMLT